jgi:predicted amidohydrolase
MKKTLIALLLCMAGLAAFAQTQSATTTQATAADTEALKAYAGRYTFSENFQQCTVVIKDGSLYAEVDQNGQNKLIAQKEPDKFQSTSSYGTIFTFRRNADKVVTSVKLELMGQEIIGEKAKE